MVAHWCSSNAVTARATCFAPIAGCVMQWQIQAGPVNEGITGGLVRSLEAAYLSVASIMNGTNCQSRGDTGKAPSSFMLTYE